MNSRLEQHKVRLRGLTSEPAKAGFVPFQPAVSTAGGHMDSRAQVADSRSFIPGRPSAPVTPRISENAAAAAGVGAGAGAAFGAGNS
jgi:hypothetical protein